MGKLNAKLKSVGQPYGKAGLTPSLVLCVVVDRSFWRLLREAYGKDLQQGVEPCE